MTSAGQGFTCMGSYIITIRQNTKLTSHIYHLTRNTGAILGHWDISQS